METSSEDNLLNTKMANKASKTYYEANKDKLLEKARQKYQEKKEEYKLHYQENKDKFKEKYEKNKDRVKQYYQQNREKLLQASLERQKLKLEQKRREKEQFNEIIQQIKEGKVQVVPIQTN